MSDEMNRAQIFTLNEELAKVREERDRLNTRCHELERNREIFQEQRDQAIRERGVVEEHLAAAVKGTSVYCSIQAQKPEPGSIVIVRFPEFENEGDKRGIQASIAFIAKRHPEWTIVATHLGKEITFEEVPESMMRRKGWLRAERVELAPQVLDAALGAYRATLVHVREMLDKAGLMHRTRKQIEDLLAQPIPAFPLQKPAAPAGGEA